VELVGKVVVVTGGGSGIGREVAPKLASRLIYRQTKSLRSSP
jgi:NAD(P)-dependent dehydrogenase (short-subunit alcohol dehydrogenase family)